MSQIIYFCIFGLIILYARKSAGVALPTDVATDVDVLIVGSGPSGIAAATKLNQQGVDVIVLEAQSRYGGRVHSIRFGDAYVDMGAEWCHGEEGNIVYEMMRDSNILQHPNYTFTLIDSDGEEIDQDMTEQLGEIFWSFYGTEGTRNATAEDTVGSYFTRLYYDEIKSKYSNDPKKYSVAQMAYHSFNGYILSSEGSFSWFEPSALSDFKDCKGDHTLTWSGHGYKTILDKMMENFDKDKKIKLSSPVKKIAFDAKHDKVHVSLANNEKLTANHVVFTPSVGVLKSQHVSLFEPPLPADKVKAIDAIGIGAVMKVLLYYPERWWWDSNSTTSGVTFLWTREDRDTLAAQYSKGPRRFGQSWLTNFIGIYRVEQNPKVLSCWFTGEFIPEIENLDDQTLLDGINFAMRKFIGKLYTIGKPDKFVRSFWYGNEYFRGTYSYQTLDSRKITPSANIVLSEPITNEKGVPKILFAGEATHPYHYSTVHGAIESGYREADRLTRTKQLNPK